MAGGIMRHLPKILIAALAALLGVALAPPASAKLDHQAPFCGIYWGSLEKSELTTEASRLTNVRAGRHECFDRLVFDFAGNVDGYRVSYEDHVATDGAGVPIHLKGGADLEIVVSGAAHDHRGNLTYRPSDRDHLVDVAGWDTFRQVAWAGDYEGQITVGLGVRARLPFRVFTLDGPGDGSRIVIDVAHRW